MVSRDPEAWSGYTAKPLKLGADPGGRAREITRC